MMGMRLSLVMVRAEEFERLSQDPSALFQLLLHGRPDSRLTMAKEWHGIHFLLTGEPWRVDHPRGMVILGGDEIGDSLAMALRAR
jgi:hypothetical protein